MEEQEEASKWQLSMPLRGRSWSPSSPTQGLRPCILQQGNKAPQGNWCWLLVADGHLWGLASTESQIVLCQKVATKWRAAAKISLQPEGAGKQPASHAYVHPFSGLRAVPFLSTLGDVQASSAAHQLFHWRAGHCRL